MHDFIFEVSAHNVKEQAGGLIPAPNVSIE
jgi:hypothetical protein